MVVGVVRRGNRVLHTEYADILSVRAFGDSLSEPKETYVVRVSPNKR